MVENNELNLNPKTSVTEIAFFIWKFHKNPYT